MKRREEIEIKIHDYSQKFDDVYENVEDYNPTKKGNMFDGMKADMKDNKRFNPLVPYSIP